MMYIRFQNVTFKQDFKNVESEIYLEIRSQLVSLINSINEITNQSLLSAEVFQMMLVQFKAQTTKYEVIGEERNRDKLPFQDLPTMV